MSTMPTGVIDGLGSGEHAAVLPIVGAVARPIDRYELTIPLRLFLGSACPWTVTIRIERYAIGDAQRAGWKPEGLAIVTAEGRPIVFRVYCRRRRLRRGDGPCAVELREVC